MFSMLKFGRAISKSRIKQFTGLTRLIWMSSTNAKPNSVSASRGRSPNLDNEEKHESVDNLGHHGIFMYPTLNCCGFVSRCVFCSHHAGQADTAGGLLQHAHSHQHARRDRKSTRLNS